MNKEIAWVTGDNFLDVDIPILKELSNKFEIHWYIIFSKNKTVSYTEDEIRKVFSGLSTKIVVIRLQHRFISLITLIQYINLTATLRYKKYSIIYCNFLGIPYFYPIINVFLSKKKVIYAAHDVVDHLNIKNRKHIKNYKSFIFKSFRNFQTFSHTQMELFQKMYPNKNIFYAPLYLKDFGSSNIKKNPNTIRFLFFGSIRENKGLECLIKAGNLLYKQYPNRFIIKIAGRCENWGKYKSLIKYKSAFDLQIEVINNHDIPSLYAQSHFLVLPYRDITQSGPLMIAYNYNIPVIASDLKGFREYIEDGETGFLNKTNDHYSLYSKMMKAMKSVENGTYENMKKELQSFTEQNISITSITKRYAEFFNTFSNGK